jgi:hypothetical protein
LQGVGGGPGPMSDGRELIKQAALAAVDRYPRDGRLLPPVLYLWLAIPAESPFSREEEQIYRALAESAVRTGVRTNFSQPATDVRCRVGWMAAARQPEAVLREAGAAIQKAVLEIQYVGANSPLPSSIENVDEITIGTGPGSNVVIDRLAGRGVSKRHCRVAPIDGKLYVFDGIWEKGVQVSPSTNGTAVDGTRLGNDRTEWRRNRSLVLVPDKGDPGRPGLWRDDAQQEIRGVTITLRDAVLLDLDAIWQEHFPSGTVRLQG